MRWRVPCRPESGNDLCVGKLGGEAARQHRGTSAFIPRDRLTHMPDACIKEEATKIGYEVRFTRHFDKPQHFRSELDGLLKTGKGR